MNGKTMVPLIDLVFLTLGSILAAMTQMERVEAIPVAVAQVAGSGQAVQRGEFDVVTVTARGVTVGKRVVDEARLAEEIAGRRVVLRIERTLPTQRALAVLARITDVASEVTIEVRRDKTAQDGSQ